MKEEKFYDIMCRPFDLTQEDTTKVDEIVKKYPYFQAARMLLLRGTKVYHQTEYPSTLKRTAAHAANRALLFDYINHNNFLEKNSKESLKIPKAKKTEEKQRAATQNFIKIKKVSCYTFSNWLLLSDSNAKEELQKKTTQQMAIDRFIQLNPKLPTLKNQQERSNICLKSIAENQDLMTETLANLYVEQKKYTKAQQAFKILSLKYPKKSGYFANKIREIKHLEENKL